MNSPDNWEHKFIQTNGINLRYVTCGQGKLMLLLHGFPEFWYSWRHQIAEFARDYRVVALDLRGYNDSDKPEGVKAYSLSELVRDVRGVITGLGYRDCILVSHDWGGAIAWNFVYTYPTMVEKLIVLNLPHPAKFLAGLRTPRQLLRSWYIFFFQLPVIPELILKWNNYEAIASAFREMAVDKTAFTPDDLNAFKQAAAKPGSLTAMLNYHRCFWREFPDHTRQYEKIIDIPTLMIWGEKDTALGKELTYGTEKYVSNLQIRYIPNCSHWVQQERSELVNRYIKEFLSSTVGNTR